MKHKLLNPLRLLMVALCMLGIAAEGQNVVQDDFNFELNPATHTATCKGYNGSSNAPVMPSIINYEGEEYPVTFIWHYAFAWQPFSTITLPETLKKIGEAAFQGSSIESIIVPNSVDTIMAMAFSMCNSLYNVKLSENMTVMPMGIFYMCQSLESIEIPESVKRFSLGVGMDEETMTWIGDADFFWDPGFFSGEGLEFCSCDNLKTVILPSQLTSLSLSAFQECYNLNSCEIPQTIDALGIMAFLNCPLKEIEIPANLNAWGDLCFTPSDATKYVKSYSDNPHPSVNLGLSSVIDCPLYVPKGLPGVYRNIGGQWNCFSRIVEATPVELEGEWRTFCAVEDLDFSEVEGLEAYIATEYQDGKVLMERIEQVPAGTGVVLKGAPGFYEIPYPEQDEALEPVDNLLVGLNYGERIQAETEDGQCNLFFNDATEMASLFYGPFMDAERAPRLNAEGEQPMFAPADGARLPYHRAYLQLPASEAGKTVEMVFGNLTGIEEVEAQPQTDGNIYNLQGQRVVNPGPGIYIQNGRKFIVR